MRMELERTAYKKLLEWKKNAGHSTLEVSGARQVGKTYLVNKFADQEYEQKIYINLLELSGELFLNHYEGLWREMTQGKRFENPIYELIRRYEPSFTDSPDTVVTSMRSRNQQRSIIGSVSLLVIFPVILS